MKVTKEELVKYAKVVRAKCYSFAHLEASKDFFYHKERTLKYMCAVSSATLVEYLSKRGIKSYCVFTKRHCWVSCGKYFIDLTCSQYGFVDLMILEKGAFLKFIKGTDKSHYYSGYKKVTDYEYDFAAWGGGQQPTTNVIKSILKIGESNV